LSAKLLHAPFNNRAFAAPFDDGRIVLIDDHLFRSTEIFDLHVLQPDAQIVGDCTALGEDGNIIQDRFPSIAKSGCFHRRRLQRARSRFTTRVASASPSIS
jgi:hypothetical protein